MTAAAGLTLYDLARSLAQRSLRGEIGSADRSKADKDSRDDEVDRACPGELLFASLGVCAERGKPDNLAFDLPSQVASTAHVEPSLPGGRKCPKVNCFSRGTGVEASPARVARKRGVATG